ISAVPDPAPAQAIDDDSASSGLTEAQRQEQAMRDSMTPIEAHKGEDPFAGMKTESQESVATASTSKSDAIKWNEPVTPSSASIPAPTPPPPPPPPASTAHTPPARPQQQVAAKTSPPTSADGYYKPAFSVKDALAGAKVANVADIRLVDKVSGAQ